MLGLVGDAGSGGRMYHQPGRWYNFDAVAMGLIMMLQVGWGVGDDGSGVCLPSPSTGPSGTCTTPLVHLGQHVI